MAARECGDGDAEPGTGQNVRLPRRHAGRLCESATTQSLGSVVSGQHRHGVIEMVLRHPIPVVTVHVRKYARVDRWKLLHAERRLVKPLGHQSVAEVGVLALVQEVRIGEQGDVSGGNQRRRVADERDGNRAR